MSVKTNNSDQKFRRSGVAAPVAVARAVRGITEKSLGKVGQSFAQLLSHWPQIVGPELASKCLPTALNFPKTKNSDATLHLATNSANALELAHSTPMLLDRVNSFMGYKAIANIRLDHTQMPDSEFKVVAGAFRGAAGQSQALRAPVVRDDAPVPQAVCEIYSDIKDPELREKLESLCRAVASAA
jgi:hypothetical protein